MNYSSQLLESLKNEKHNLLLKTIFGVLILADKQLISKCNKGV